MKVKDLFAVRDVSDLVAETEEEGHSLKNNISALGLTAIGVGAIIGTGIFVVIGEGVKEAGPALIFAFVLAAVTCAFSALSYAELAAAVPVSGSAYTFSYATLGELVAFIIGWDLILEYGVSVAGVAVGWGGNVNEFLQAAFGFELPLAISKSPSEGGVFNITAVFIVAVITVLLTLGTRESAMVNAVMVMIKLAILIFFIIVAFTAFHSGNFVPFAPHGAAGVTAAAGVIFFAYIGFDAVSTGSEESKNPGRDLPIAVIGSLLISTVLYVIVAIAAVGVAPIDTLTGSDAPLAAALREGAGLPWAGGILALGALIAITSVVLVIMYGQTRIFFAMCRDGLLPRRLAHVHPRYGTPARLTIGFGILIAILAAFVPLDEIVKLVNIGTLFAFILVNIGVVVLRRTKPDMKRPFRVPLTTYLRFIIWLVIGLAIYFLYSVKHSRLREDKPPADAPVAGSDPR